MPPNLSVAKMDSLLIGDYGSDEEAESTYSNMDGDRLQGHGPAGHMPTASVVDEDTYPNTDNAYPNTDNAYPNTDAAYPDGERSWARSMLTAVCPAAGTDAYPNTDDAYPNTDEAYPNTDAAYPEGASSTLPFSGRFDTDSRRHWWAAGSNHASSRRR